MALSISIVNGDTIRVEIPRDDFMAMGPLSNDSPVYQELRRIRETWRADDLQAKRDDLFARAAALDEGDPLREPAMKACLELDAQIAAIRPPPDAP